VKALGKENVIPILMPSQFSSTHSIEDSIELCKNLGCQNHIIEIESIYQAFEQQLKPLFKGTEFGIAEENIQSRTRGALLMAHTNKFGTILLNTSNKSELAVGYGTLYGDMSGGISVLGDLYKTEVFELSKHLNREVEIIPNNIIIKPPSAELRPDQKDSDSLPDYEILDAILKETEKEEALLIKKSKEFGESLDEHLYTAYNRIRTKVKNGLAVVAIERGASGGSYFTIPPQVQLEIANRKKITIDEHSGRILVDAALAEEEKEKMDKMFS
jgi:NAD+ synthase (glutamine-hydrolysing)